MINDFLLQLRKPGRYIGKEWNSAKKDFESADLKFALCFPDLYEVGMSNLGVRILYGILNNKEGVTCERVFSPDIDMEKILREKCISIVSLESQKPLMDFDVIGFSLGSELNYTNALNILDLAKIPLKSEERDNDFPLVIAGGPCVLNPEPIHEFFDLFIIGEAEELILELVKVYREVKAGYKSGKVKKEELLSVLSDIEGVYAPLMGSQKKVKKRVVKDLDSAPFPSDWIVPYIQIIHDRISLEIMRGCPRRCRFCQARSQYYPLRVRKAQGLIDLALQTYKKTGYEEISLSGLSVSEYPDLARLVNTLIPLFKEKAVSISLPSIRAEEKLGEISSVIASIKKTGLTFAPEAGNKRLRDILCKDFDEQVFFETIEKAYLSGYQHLKLYFMIGLPFEKDEDLKGILDFATRSSESRRKAKGHPAQVNISVSNFIPKPHTPFQWFSMQGIDEVERKQEYLKGNLKNRRLKLNFHNSKMSFLEGVLSRGDRRLSEVILSAFLKGARFDAWGNYFSYELWGQAFRESGIEPGDYLKEKPLDVPLPWDFIEIGIPKESLMAEFNKVIATE